MTKRKQLVTPRPRKTSQEPDHEADGYGDLHRAVARAIPGPLFTTSAEGLFAAFLAEITTRRRAHYACTACRRFVDQYGGLVRIAEDGTPSPAIWPADDVPSFFHDAVATVRLKILRSKVTGVFLSSLHTWGTPSTPPWQHLHALNPTPFRATALKTAKQAMAEKLEEYGMLCRALADFPLETVDQAARLLRSEALYRSEKCEGVATWLQDLHRARAKAKGRAKDTLTWLAVATAPVGFAHVRSTMIGTLLEDIASGLSFDAVSRRFAEKMHPLQYQRPTSPPSDGQIARAEKVVAELATAGALRRRYARLADIRPLWTPTPKPQAPSAGGVFGQLKTVPPDRSIEIPPVTLTWEKFQRTVLSEAAEIQALVPRGNSSFAALVTAADPAAPPILQWDTPEDRNPVNWYFYNNGSLARRWGLEPGTWVRVTAICLKPSAWGARPLAHQGDGIFILLEGARDTGSCGLALFPETLRSEYHEIRRTIEAFSNKGEIEGRAEAEACGLGFSKDTGHHRWSDAVLRVTSRDGGVAHFTLDRWD